MSDTPPEQYIAQPLMVMASQRIECNRCRARAVWLVLDADDWEAFHDGGTQVEMSAWCHDCWQREQASEG